MLDIPAHIPPDTSSGTGAPRPHYRSPLSSVHAMREDIPEFASALRLHSVIEQRMAAARPRLVRLARLRGVPGETADDVAQETLLEAWRALDALRDMDRLDLWLDAICRNICRRWARTHAALAARQQPFAVLRPEIHGEDEVETDVADPQAFEPEEELTRQELATLLDRALAHLHPGAREPLVLHYIAGLPAGEIAARMGLSTSAVEVRLHRARRELRRVLSGALREEAEAFGIALPEIDAEGTAGRRETRIWCPLCGEHHLGAEINRTTGETHYWCASCGHLAGWICPPSWLGGTSCKPLLKRMLAALTDFYTLGLATGQAVCNCGSIARIEPQVPDELKEQVRERIGEWIGEPLALQARCPRCGLFEVNDLGRLTIDRMETQHFWREHPRIRVLPARDVETAGVPAVVIGVECRTDGARLDVVWARETLHVLGVHEASGNS